MDVHKEKMSSNRKRILKSDQILRATRQILPKCMIMKLKALWMLILNRRLDPAEALMNWKTYPKSTPRIQQRPGHEKQKRFNGLQWNDPMHRKKEGQEGSNSSRRAIN